MIRLWPMALMAHRARSSTVVIRPLRRTTTVGLLRSPHLSAVSRFRLLGYC